MRGTGAVVLSLGIATCLVGAADAAPTPVNHQVVTILAAQPVRATPSGSAAVVGKVVARTPITGVATVLPVLERTRGWLRVALPGRPNGHNGWIRSAGTRHALITWRLVVDLSARRLAVLEGSRVVRTFRAVVGKPATPTPTGTFFVEEVVRLSGADVGAPFALALSARSTVLQEFDGGPGQIAIHGRDNVGGTLGTATSHGCVRLDDDAMRWLAGRIDAGTDVTITN